MKALHLRDVSFKYEGSANYAVNGLTLDVERGEFFTLLGPNGSGKSTICMLTNGLIPHAIKGALEGEADVFELDVRKHVVAELATRVGIIFQEPESQLFCMSVEEEVAFGPENLAVPRDDIRERVDWALDLVGMKGYNDRSPFSLSGGQKQRVAIAAALSMRPDMLVLDEPAYALDPIGRTELYTVLRDLKEKHGMTVILAERDAEEASIYSDRVAIMRDGRLVDVGPPRKILRDSDRLRSLGISPPQMSEVSSLLSQKLKKDISFLGVEEAERMIRSLVTSSKEGQRR